MSLPSAQRKILEDLAKLGHDKWGFVIYRCTYRDNQAWDLFKDIVRRRTLEDMADSDAPEAADRLEWTFVDDEASLDGASKNQLRARFRQWATEAISTENPRAEHHQIFAVPRYRYLIQVDEQSLRSVVSSPALDPLGKGYVNFVDSQWTQSSGDDDDASEEDEEGYELIEGCAEEDVGWMKIAAIMIDASFYDIASSFAYGGWLVYYKRPPATVLY
ncbi:hypothetical protein KC332_g6544 [Hortaea werneckii]|nr:hypothetical protein KC358_g4642 [Hortaea werneckii]KAI6850507.1 hypothetical protein KC350_g2114 [Hortaea werneckii]KAI6943351.1 hypothetical protein KC341_g1572 [Hortaea werneckii]KAI6949280.1 hypothetical protein KC348_g1442 [Hortaea werneckii]KAI6981112.1 hypothetical protein KC321_g1394 [Hortaea werneckii]